MGLLSSSSSSSQRVTNYNTSATGAIQAGAGASSNLSGLNLYTGAGGKGGSGGDLSVTLTDQGAVAQSYDLADRAYSSVENALAGVAEFASTSLDRIAEAFKTTQQQTLGAFQAANDFTSDAMNRQVPTLDPQKTLFAALAAVAVIAFVVIRSK